MNDIITIAQSTFHKVARMKALYLILVICVLDVAAMSAYKDLSLGIEKQLMVDCALAIILVVGLITAMIAAFEIPRELREKTAQFILSKPMGRSAFVWGKFLGVAALCLFNIAFVTAGSMGAYRMAFGELHWGILHGAILIAGEAIILTGVGLLLSVLFTDTLSAVVLFVVFAVGHCIHILPRMHPNLISKACSYILPYFHNMDVKTEISHGVAIAPAYVGYGVGYAVAYALGLTGLAVVLFSRKDIS